MVAQGIADAVSSAHVCIAHQLSTACRISSEPKPCSLKCQCLYRPSALAEKSPLKIIYKRDGVTMKIRREANGRT